MEDIRFYNFEGQLLAIVHDIVSVNWRICYNDVGTFEAHFNLQSSFVPDIALTPWLVAVQGGLQAIITGRQMGEELILYGKTPNWLLCKRGIPPFVTGDMTEDEGVTVPQIASWVFSKAFDRLDPVKEEAAKGEFLQEPFAFWRNTTNQAFEVMRDCADRESAGHRIWFEPKTGTWHFQLYKGNELSIMLSEDNRNAYETEYTEDISELATAGWYGREVVSRGDYNPVTNKPPLKNGLPENFGKYYQVTQSGSRFGLAMKEGDYLLCDSQAGIWRIAEGEEMQELNCIWLKLEGDSSASGIYRWDEILSAQTESVAQDELTKKKRIQDISLITRDLKYGKDYELGDIIRVQKTAGGVRLTQKKRVVAVNIWYEQGNSGQQPEFSEQ